MKLHLPLLCLINTALAARIFLSPQPLAKATRVSTQLAGSRLAQHLGLEEFETYAGHYTYGEEVFVGQGQRSGLLVSVDEQDIDNIVPSSLEPTFSIKNAAESFDSLLTTYLRRAQHVYAHIIDSPLSSPVPAGSLDAFFLTIPSSPESRQLYDEIRILAQFIDAPSPSTFAAVELRGLSLLRNSMGASSEAYQAAAKFTKAFVESALAQSERVRLALITHDAKSVGAEKREPQQSPLPNPLPPQPIYTHCFTTSETCSNSTNSCSGHGQCVETTKAGATCFVCACRATKDKGKTNTWVGEKCERKDVSGPFVLITGTAIALLLVGYGSVSLLANVGTEELPSTLMGGVVNSRKD